MNSNIRDIEEKLKILPKNINIAPPNPHIKVVGLGGFGGRIAERMMAMGIEGLDYLTITWERQIEALGLSPARIYLREGGISEPNEDSVRKNIEINREKIEDAFFGVDLVFLIAGLGGITGETAMPLIAEITEYMRAETVCVVTMPPPFQGKEKILKALSKTEALQKQVEALECVLPTLYEQGKALSIQKIFEATEIDLCKYVEKLIVARKNR